MEKTNNRPKKIKLYTLFNTINGLTSQTQWDERASIEYHVAAYSIRQAYYLAGTSVWYDGHVGILERGQLARDEAETWINYRGAQSMFGQFPTCGARALNKYELELLKEGGA